MSGVDLLIPNPSSEEDILALQSFVNEMLKMNKVLIARFVYRQNSDPKLVVLTPHQSKRGPVFYLNVLPTVEDIRDFQFSSLDQCSIQQEEVVSKFIDSLDLEQNGEELLKPNETYNPVLQYFYQCLEAKALDKSEDFPLSAGYFGQLCDSGGAERVTVLFIENYSMQKKPYMI